LYEKRRMGGGKERERETEREREKLDSVFSKEM
jgi:hypothetical protein